RCWCLGFFILFFDYLLPVVPIATAYDRSAFSDEVRGWKCYEELQSPFFPFLSSLWLRCAEFFMLCGKKEDGNSLKMTRSHSMELGPR
ncbi:hypothetical protein PFISCL1PPCAC_20966, partial [Pristionchus fissidentatus]